MAMQEMQHVPTPEENALHKQQQAVLMGRAKRSVGMAFSVALLIAAAAFYKKNHVANATGHDAS